MAKTQCANRVLIDRSQNNLARLSIAPYSLRSRDHPTVSMSPTWDEVEACRRPDLRSLCLATPRTGI
ncbi:hypothetical protein [Amycolatopsis pretoriensis]|uniref:non-homologous end-joining DNA ligase LigD n=1 Tax=Amycolatopsis pretoriensis TaxID=218821 RepID=UPI0031345CE2